MPGTLPASHQIRSSCTTILLIDDDQQDLMYWSDAVRKLGKNYTVLTAQDRKSGLAICKDRTVDCVLLDLDMPESGFEILLELVPDPKHPKIAVLILTRLVYPTLCEIAKLHGAQGWCVKRDTSAEQLDNAIQEAVVSINSQQ
jgi:CheY-like chemotaxis protein